jgi:hypothetical protein
VVEIKRKIVEGKEGKKGGSFGRAATLGLHSTPTFILLHILLLSCLLH